MERRLAAILAADVVGYSRLMGFNEEGTLSTINELRTAVLGPLIAQRQGRIVKVMGDGLIAEFGSVVNALACAVEIQSRLSERNARLPSDIKVEYRIGVNLGDVILEDDDVFGDGVNVAARLEGICSPGGVVVSASVREQVGERLDLKFDDLGEQTLKNIARPVRAYAIAGSEATPTSTPNEPQIAIAVLPFANMSGEPEQEYFSDGITEDIITDLSKVSALRVISRNTAFAYKGKTADAPKLHATLKISHLVEGSVRKAGGRVRITAQLIDAAKDSHIWAERYDRDLNDIFALQDEISAAIVDALRIRLQPEEKQRIARRSTANAEAFQYYLMARQYVQRHSNRNLEIAIRFAKRALEIDPEYARALALVAICQSSLALQGNSPDTGLAAAEKALSMDATLGEAYAAKGQALAAMGRVQEGLAAHRESLRHDPDSYEVNLLYGTTSVLIGDHATASTYFVRASDILEEDVRAIGLAYQAFEAQGMHDKAQHFAQALLVRVEAAIAKAPDDARATLYGASVLAFLGQKDRAREWTTRALLLEPDDALVQYNCACALVVVGDTDAALNLLERCHAQMGPDFIHWTKHDPELMSVRDHPRFKKLLADGEDRLRQLRGKG